MMDIGKEYRARAYVIIKINSLNVVSKINKMLRKWMNKKNITSKKRLIELKRWYEFEGLIRV